MQSLPVADSSTAHFPALYARDAHTASMVREFFTARVRNANTRRAYGRAAAHFSEWCQTAGLEDLRQVESWHIASYIEQMREVWSAPTLKQNLAGLRMLLDWLVVRQVIPVNPAAAVRGPRHTVKKGKTPVLAAAEVRALLDSIDAGTVQGLRDRALTALLVYTFARVGAALQMRREDVYWQGRRLWVRLHEKGGKQHTMPCHHRLEEYLEAYLEASGGDAKGWLFRTISRRPAELSERPMTQPDAYRMIRRRAAAAGIRTRIGCHSFRATGITEYLRNGGKLEIAQQMANHESARTTGLYDRRQDQVSLDEVERILI